MRILPDLTGAGRVVKTAAAWALVVCCVACGGKDEPVVVEQGSALTAATSPDAVVWAYQPAAVTINLQAAADLNLEGDQAHTLVLCVYQLAKQDSFKALAGSSEGITQLLQCKPFDDSAKVCDKSVVAPGHIMSLVYDRAEGARHVGIVAGYASLDPARVTRLRSIPIAKETTGSLWYKQDIFYPGLMNMAVLLGANGLQQLPAQDEIGSEQ